MNPAVEGLRGICGFVQIATGADLVVAVEIGAAGRTEPLCAAPVAVDQPFQLRPAAFLDLDWSAGPRDACGVRVPSILLQALGRPIGQILFVASGAEGSIDGGLILLWADGVKTESLDLRRPDVVAEVPQLAEALGQTLAARRALAAAQSSQNNFSDLFETVPAGIVVMDGSAQTSLVNERAAAVLGISAGRHPAGELVRPMKRLRDRCINREELEAEFGTIVGHVDYAAKTIWNLGDQQFEVDTHPVRGDGLHGRIWLFNDVTAELRMTADLRALAFRDGLTGIANRRHFDEQSRTIMAARKDGDRPVAILMIDIDHFKMVNDTHGHPVGDQVLKVVAQRTSRALRERDLLARFGGEEFIVLARADEAELQVIAERVRSAVAGSPIVAGSTLLDVRVSLGGAVARDDETIAALIGRADIALYEAKRGGRDRVVVAGPPA